MSILGDVAYEYQKVSVGLSGVIHLSLMAGHKTLCGRWWWADNNHGDTYCRTCQHILAKRFAKIKNTQPVAVKKEWLPKYGST